MMEWLSINELIGLLIGLSLGGICRWFDLPLPAPPRLSGALLVVTMTAGFFTANALMQ